VLGWAQGRAAGAWIEAVLAALPDVEGERPVLEGKPTVAADPGDDFFFAGTGRFPAFQRRTDAADADGDGGAAAGASATGAGSGAFAGSGRFAAGGAAGGDAPAAGAAERDGDGSDGSAAAADAAAHGEPEGDDLSAPSLEPPPG